MKLSLYETGDALGGTVGVFVRRERSLLGIRVVGYIRKRRLKKK